MRGTSTDYINEDNTAAFGDFGDTVLSGSGFTGTSLPQGGMSDWGTWFQNVGTAVVQTGLNTYQYGQLAQNGGIPAISPKGTVYTEGQRAPVAYGPSQAANSLGVSPVVLIGAAVVVAAFILLRK